MRIAVLTDDRAVQFPEVADLVDALDRRGHVPAIFRAGDAGSRVSEGAAAAGLAEELRETWSGQVPDVVHAFGTTAGLAACAVERSDVPLVYDGRYCADAADPRRARLQLALARRAEQTVAAGGGHVEELVDGGVARRSITVVPHGVDLGTFRVDGPGASRAASRRLVAVVDFTDPFLVEVLDALPLLPGVELLLPGVTPTGSGADVRRVVAHAEARGVRSRVRIEAGLDPSGRAKVYRSADLGVAGSVSTGAGAELLRAMACGLPLVAPGGDDCIVDGVTGEVDGTVVGGARRLARVVRRLLADEPKRSAYGIAGADRVASVYTPERASLSVEHAYNAAIAAA